MFRFMYHFQISDLQHMSSLLSRKKNLPLTEADSSNSLKADVCNMRGRAPFFYDEHEFRTKPHTFQQ